MNIRKTASEFYLLYVNEYLTVEKIAEHFEISNELAGILIKEGRKENDKNQKSLP
jgi:DNA-binding transcriptional regulator LsrR (DeoR family)